MTYLWKRIKKDRKPRTCLRCGQTFISDGPANRICPKCKRALQRSGDTYEPVRRRTKVAKHISQTEHHG